MFNTSRRYSFLLFLFVLSFSNYNFVGLIAGVSSDLDQQIVSSDEQQNALVQGQDESSTEEAGVSKVDDSSESGVDDENGDDEFDLAVEHSNEENVQLGVDYQKDEDEDELADDLNKYFKKNDVVKKGSGWGTLKSVIASSVVGGGVYGLTLWYVHSPKKSAPIPYKPFSYNPFPPGGMYTGSTSTSINVSDQEELDWFKDKFPKNSRTGQYFWCDHPRVSDFTNFMTQTMLGNFGSTGGLKSSVFQNKYLSDTFGLIGRREAEHYADYEVFYHGFRVDAVVVLDLWWLILNELRMRAGETFLTDMRFIRAPYECFKDYPTMKEVKAAITKKWMISPGSRFDMYSSFDYDVTFQNMVISAGPDFIMPHGNPSLEGSYRNPFCYFVGGEALGRSPAERLNAGMCERLNAIYSLSLNSTIIYSKVSAGIFNILGGNLFQESAAMLQIFIPKAMVKDYVSAGAEHMMDREYNANDVGNVRILMHPNLWSHIKIYRYVYDNRIDELINGDLNTSEYWRALLRIRQETVGCD